MLPKEKPKSRNRKLGAVLAVIIAALGAKYLQIDGAENFCGALDDVPKDSHAQKLQNLPLCSKHPEYTNIICDESLGFLSGFPDMCPISNFHLSDPLSGAIQNRGNIDFCPQQSWGMPFDIYDSDQLFSFGRQQACETKALIAALECYDLEAAVSHLNNIANVDGVIINGESLLHYASRNGLQNIVEILLNKGFLFDEPNSNGDTPLMLAIDNNHLQLAKLLLPKTDNIDQQNYDGNTALHYASSKGDADIVKIILGKSHSLYKKHYGGNTPLMDSLRSNNFDVAAMLAEEMVDVDQEDYFGCTALHHASWMGRADVVKILLGKTHSLYKQDSNGKTALIQALYHNNFGIAVILAEAMDDVDHVDCIGNTALHHASLKGRADVVRILLPKAKLINKENDCGQTPLQLARSYNHVEVAEFIEAEIISRSLKGTEDTEETKVGA